MTRGLRIAAIAVTAMITATPALAANQYDLKCKGSEQRATGKPATPWTETFRIDLDAKRWCRGKCTTGASIGSVTADEIVLVDSRAGIGGPADVMTTFSRATGKVREAVEAGWSGSSFGIAEGTCTRDLYSGIPGAKF